MSNDLIAIENSANLSEAVYDDAKLVIDDKWTFDSSAGTVKYKVINTSSELLEDLFPDFFGFQAVLVEKLDSNDIGTGEYEIVKGS